MSITPVFGVGVESEEELAESVHDLGPSRLRTSAPERSRSPIRKVLDLCQVLEDVLVRSSEYGGDGPVDHLSLLSLPSD